MSSRSPFAINNLKSSPESKPKTYFTKKEKNYTLIFDFNNSLGAI